MQLSVIVRDEYERAERSGRPWNLKSCREVPSNTTPPTTCHGTQCRLSPTTYYLLPTTHYLLPTTYYPLPTTPSFLHLLSPCQAICEHDEGAAALAGHVLHKLRSLHQLPMESEMELIQAFAVALRSKGFGVALHTARGAAVKYQVLPLHLANPLPFNPAHSHHCHTLPPNPTHCQSLPKPLPLPLPHPLSFHRLLS